MLEILYTCNISDDGTYIHFEDLDTFSKATLCLAADRAMYGKKAPITTVSISVYIVSKFDLGFHEDNDFNIIQFHRKSVGKTGVCNALNMMLRTLCE